MVMIPNSDRMTQIIHIPHARDNIQFKAFSPRVLRALGPHALNWILVLRPRHTTSHNAYVSDLRLTGYIPHTLDITNTYI